MALPDAVFYVEEFQSMFLDILSFAFVHVESIPIDDSGRPDVRLVGLGRIARRRTTTTLDASSSLFDLLTVLWWLASFFQLTRGKIVGLEVWFNGLHSFVEVVHIDDQILDHRLVGEWFNPNGGVEI